MSNSVAVHLVVGMALLLANLPFFTERLFCAFALAQRKSIALRLLELIIGYFLAGLIGLALEHRAGQISPQSWEFYAITAALFLTFAFPGFVYRYLLKRA